MPSRPRVLRGVAIAALIFLLVQVGALALVTPFYEAGFQTVEDPTDPTNSVVYVGAILVATAGMLAAFRFGFDWVIRGTVLATGALLAWYVLVPFLPGVAAAGLAVGLAAALYAYPEWYVVDAAGVVMGAGAAGLFGISFGLLPALLLLTVLAVYDAISVYGTEHMLDLAEGVMDLRVPVVLVIPLTLSYSFLAEEFTSREGDDGENGDGGRGEGGGRDGGSDDGGCSDAGSGEVGSDDAGSGAAGAPEPTPNGGPEGDDADADTDADADGTPTPRAGEAGDSGEGADGADGDDERDAFFVGLGDAVIPTVLVASAAFFSPAASLGVPGVPALNLPALAAMAGTFAGLFVLLRAVLRGRPHAGLPLLNGGTIAGYLLGSTLAGVPLVRALGLAGYL